MKNLLIFALFFASPALAGSMELGQARFDVNFGVRGEKMTLQEIGVMRSQPSENKEAFVMRAGTFMDGWTKKNGQEVCSIIYRKGEQFAVVPTTSHSQIGCLMPERAPEGFVATRESIHSHPLVDRQTMTKADTMFNRGTGDYHANRGEVRDYAPERFSETDIETGAGYLVAKGVVYYQDIAEKGQKSLRTVGNVLSF